MKKSESIATLATALAQFSAEVQNPHNTASNPFHKNKYAPLQDILRDMRPLLAKHGLAVTQPVHSEGERIGVTTMLVHTSGEYIADTVTMEPGAEKGKSAAQLAGSVITYLRRYSLAAILGIASEDDDDGNAGLQSKPHRETKPAPKRETKRDYSQASPADIPDGELPNAIRQGIELLDKMGRKNGAIEYREIANTIRTESDDKPTEYRELLQQIRDTLEAARGMDAYKEKEPAVEPDELF